MRRGFLILLLLAGTAQARESEPDARSRAFVEVESRPAVCFVGEPFRVRLRVGFDQRFFDTNVVPLFRRAMDFQAKVTAPFLEGIDGAVTPGYAAAGDRPPEMMAIGSRSRALTFALNDDVVAARRVEDRQAGDRTYVVLEVERNWLPTRAGEIELKGPVLQFRYATEFRGDFISGRQPVDPQEAVVTGDPVRIRVLDLPEEGRPPEFSGAVGSFSVSAETDRSEVRVGESLKATLTVDGEGDLTRFEPPRLDDLAGFHVYGAIDDRDSRPRRITYDLAPLDASVAALPPIAFASFDPTPPGRYVVQRTDPIPLSVLPGPADASPAPPPEEERPRSPVWLIVTATILAAIGLFGVLLRRRHREEERLHPDEARARVAADAVGARAGEVGADLAADLSNYLAERLSCAPAAVIGPDLAARLIRAGVREGPARNAAAILEEAVAARYGGTAAQDDLRADAVGLVRELEEWFRARPRPEPGTGFARPTR